MLRPVGVVSSHVPELVVIIKWPVTVSVWMRWRKEEGEVSSGTPGGRIEIHSREQWEADPPVIIVVFS